MLWAAAAGLAAAAFMMSRRASRPAQRMMAVILLTGCVWTVAGILTGDGQSLSASADRSARSASPDAPLGESGTHAHDGRGPDRPCWRRPVLRGRLVDRGGFTDRRLPLTFGRRGSIAASSARWARCSAFSVVMRSGASASETPNAPTVTSANGTVKGPAHRPASSGPTNASCA